MTDFIAIDGPAGSGKSSVSKAVARTLGFGYLDTGSAYRALAWHVLDRGADTADAAAVLDAVTDFPVRLGLDPDDRTVLVGDVDVTDAIRDPSVSGAVSGVARVPEVREQVNRLFRTLVADAPYPAVVVEGATSPPWWRLTPRCAFFSRLRPRCAPHDAPANSPARTPRPSRPRCTSATLQTAPSSTS